MAIALVLLGLGVRDPGLSGLDRGTRHNFVGGRKLLNLMLRLSIVVIALGYVGKAGALEFSDPVIAAESGVSGPTEGPASEAVHAQEARLRKIVENLNSVKQTIAQKKLTIIKDDPELATLKADIDAKNKVLEAKRLAIPGSAQLRERRLVLLEEIRALYQTRHDLKLKHSKNRDASGFGDASRKLDARAKELSLVLADATGQLSALEGKARSDDPEIRQLSAHLIEMQHLLAAKVDESEALASLFKKQRNLMAESRDAVEQLRGLRTAVSAPGSTPVSN